MDNEGGIVMTIGEKAKAYDKAIERAKHLMLDTTFKMKDTVISIFPELQESEDERIRKEILEYFNQYKDEGLRGANIAPWIAYLEKQKPADIKIDKSNVQKFDSTVKITTSDSSANGKELLYVCNKSYDIGFRDGVASVKPAEWSEEDEENFKWFDKFFRAESIVVGGRDIPQDKYLWFKSLRPQPHTVSIKDATKFGNLEYERGVKDGIQSEKSRQWKPTEEQVKAIDLAIRFVTDDFDEHPTLSETLRELYNDLKKI